MRTVLFVGLVLLIVCVVAWPHVAQRMDAMRAEHATALAKSDTSAGVVAGPVAPVATPEVSVTSVAVAGQSK
ncbi:MAG: hypothetical protein JW910_03090 [Anaerolineae bacterium]|nr:hypothetical protein [Anaerolineae bacterium]